jgi:hypothetical protein
MGSIHAESFSQRIVAALIIAGFVGTGAVWSAELPDPLPCSSCFIGTLQLSPNPNDSNTKILGDDLFFVDADQLVWKAGKGDITDGASIPPLFQPIIGGPWEADYLPAAVMHDHYCDQAHRVRSWRATARMFYEGMVVNHVDIIKAKTMYYAVYAFGPHWDKLADGVSCGHNCTFDVRSGVTFVPADYSSIHQAELTAVEGKIKEKEIRGDPISLNELEDMAEKTYLTNPFLHDNSK